MRGDAARGPGAPRRIEGEAEDEFLRRAVAGERRALEHLFHRHGPRIRRAVGSILRNDDEAQDAVQETWLHALGALSTFNGGSTFGTWVTRIAVNEALGRIRARARRPVAAADVDRQDAGLDPEGQAALREGLGRLQRALGGLSEGALRVFQLRELEECSVESTARQLGLTPAAVKTRLHRARHALRAAIDQAPRPRRTGTGGR
jgi:RNA polymerase sigma-70 factor (ECF subfamily)